MNLIKRILLSCMVCNLSLLHTTLFAQSHGCITITTGNCNTVGGIVNFTANQLNWTLTDAMNSNVIEYDYRTGNCATVPTVAYANPDTNGGFTFGAMDTSTGAVWQSNNPNCLINSADYRLQYGQFGNIHCTFSNQYLNGFDFNTIGAHARDGNDSTYSGMPWPQVISQFLDSIPTGYLFFMYAVSKPPYATLWAQDSGLVNKLAAMGATDLPRLCNPNSSNALPAAPYIFWSVKGNSNWGGEAVGTSYDSILTVSFCYGSTVNGIVPISSNTHFQIYPNPVSSDKEFSVSTSQAGNIIFYNVLGQILNERILISGSNQLKLTSGDQVVLYKVNFTDGSMENGKLIYTQ